MLLHGTEATQNRFFAFWEYFLALFLKKATTSPGIFSWKLLAPLNTARKHKIFGKLLLKVKNQNEIIQYSGVWKVCLL